MKSCISSDERKERSDRDRTVDNAQSAKCQDRRNVDRDQQARHGVENLRRHGEALPCVDDARLAPEPLHEERALGSAGFESFDALEPRNGASQEHAFLLQERRVCIRALARDDPERENVEAGDPERTSGQESGRSAPSARDKRAPQRPRSRWPPGGSRAVRRRGRRSRRGWRSRRAPAAKRTSSADAERATACGSHLLAQASLAGAGSRAVRAPAARSAKRCCPRSPAAIQKTHP